MNLLSKNTRLYFKKHEQHLEDFIVKYDPRTTKRFIQFGRRVYFTKHYDEEDEEPKYYFPTQAEI